MTLHSKSIATQVIRAVAAVSVGVLVSAVTSIPAGAEGPHQVRYTVTADNPVYARVYYREVDPPTFADYSHDPYSYSPTAEADLGRPGLQWGMDVTLLDPDHWAMVTVTSADSGVTAPGFHCTLTVDGAVVADQRGARGAVCSVRSW